MGLFQDDEPINRLLKVDVFSEHFMTKGQKYYVIKALKIHFEYIEVHVHVCCRYVGGLYMYVCRYGCISTYLIQKFI